MTPRHLAEITRIAERARKHSGKGAWDSRERIVAGSIDVEAERPFVVCHVDPDDELPVAAGVAIAAHIESAQPSVVLALVAEIKRLENLVHPMLTIDANGNVVRLPDHFDDVSIGADDEANEARPA